MRVVNRLTVLMAEKQIKENRLINVATVARDTGLSRLTIASWVKGDVRRFDEDVIVALCKYFDCDLCDLIKLERD
jgi:putative transcriptional regulator